jgi:hypothetical protein
MLRLEPALDLTGTEHLTHMHGIGKVFKGVPPEIAVIEERAYQPVCHRRDDEGIGLGDRLYRSVWATTPRLFGNNEIAHDSATVYRPLDDFGVTRSFAKLMR